MQAVGVIPVGFNGWIRRVLPGSGLQIDHSHPELEFNLILRGRGTYVVEEERLELRSGALVWLQPGQQHQLLRSPNLEMWVVTAHSDLLDEAFRRDVAVNPIRLLSGDDALELDRLLTQVAQDADEPALFNAGLAYALRRARRATRDSAGQVREPLHPAVLKALFLLRSDADAASIDDLASVSGVSRSYLGRLLVQQTGRGFTEWRNRIRLERFYVAYSKSQSLTSAALDAGFGSYVQFHRVCRELMGCTPKEWVRDWTKADGAAGEARSGGDDTTPSDKPKPVARSARRQAETSGSLSPALPSSYGVPPGLDGRQRNAWHPLAGTILPGVVRWWDVLLVGTMLEHDAEASLEVAASSDDVRSVHVRRPAPDAVDRHVQELCAHDEGTAMQVASALALHDDPLGLFVHVATSYGLDGNSVADALAGCLGLAWLVANGAADPGFPQAQGLRRQCRNALANSLAFGRMTDLEQQDAYESFACQFAITYSAYIAARTSGNPASLHHVSDAVAAALEDKLGWSVRVFRLSDNGLERIAPSDPVRPGGATRSHPRRREGVRKASPARLAAVQEERG